jgi:hypothetical protein
VLQYVRVSLLDWHAGGFGNRLEDPKELRPIKASAFL